MCETLKSFEGSYLTSSRIKFCWIKHVRITNFGHENWWWFICYPLNFFVSVAQINKDVPLHILRLFEFSTLYLITHTKLCKSALHNKNIQISFQYWKIFCVTYCCYWQGIGCCNICCLLLIPLRNGGSMAS